MRPLSIKYKQNWWSTTLNILFTPSQGTLVKKSIGCKCMGLLLDFQSYFISLYIYPYASTKLFWLLQLCQKFRNQKVNPSALFFFFWHCLGYLESLASPYEFEDHLFYLWKKAAGILLDSILSVEHFESCYHLNTIRSSNPWTAMYDHLFKSNFSYKYFIMFSVQVFYLLG